MILLIDKILTPYIISRYNAINDKLNGDFFVLFEGQSESNRQWNELPDIKFKYQILKDIPIKIKGKDLFTLHLNYNFPLVLQGLNPTKIIMCGWDNPIVFYSLIWAKIKNIPFTIWAGSTKYEQSWRRRITIPLVKLLIKNCTDYISYGTRSSEYLVSLGANPSKIQPYDNSVDNDFFIQKSKLLHSQKEKIKKELGINTKYTILSNAQLIVRKGVYELIRGFSELQKTNTNISLILIGSGQERSNLEKLAINLNLHNIYFTGHLQYSELPKYYSISDIFILSSHEEVWGLTVNEAMCFGLPVIVSKFCGCSVDLVKDGENGYILDTVTPQSIYNALSKILKSNLISKNTSSKIIDQISNQNILKTFHI